jgi:hypothetical protein
MEVSMAIEEAVGRNAPNNSADVQVVQELLRNNGARLVPARPPAVSGICDQTTIACLELFQQRIMGIQPTGRVEPNGVTWYALNGQSGPSGKQHAVLEESLRAMEAEAIAFAQRFIQNASVRANYIAESQKASAETMALVEAKKLTPQAGAARAHALRNSILDASRLSSSDIGRAVAEAEKATGKTIQQLMEHYAKKLHGRAFNQLSAAEQDVVFLEIIRASGRPNPRFSASAARLGKVGKGVLVVTIAIAAYTIAASDRPGREAAKQGTTIAVGFMGSVAGGAAAGFVCGPGAPVCVGVGAFVGGLAFALGADLTFDWLWE